MQLGMPAARFAACSVLHHAYLRLAWQGSRQASLWRTYELPSAAALQSPGPSCRLCRADRLVCQARSLHTTAAAAAIMPAAAGKVSKKPVPQEVQEFWQQQLERVDKPGALKLVQFIDLTQWLGVQQGKRAQLQEFHERVKREHPTKVIIVRVGDFYETVGIDAIMLMQYTGLNQKGAENPPAAGCQRLAIHRTLRDLIEQGGLSAVVCEEVPEYTRGKRAKQKERFISQVVTPAQPSYLYGMVQDATSNAELAEAPPLLGVAASVYGFKVIAITVDMATVTETDGLTEDAVLARLHRGGMATPLYLHTSLGDASGDSRISQASPVAQFTMRMQQICRSQVGVVQRFGGPDPVEALLAEVKRDHGLEADAEFTRVAAARGTRPRPLYSSSAAQLGLHPTPGVPQLLDFLLPAKVPLAARDWLRGQLLLPPPPRVGASVRTACSLLTNLPVALPHYPVMAPRDIVCKLRAQEANDVFFRDLVRTLAAVADTADRPELQPLGTALLPAVELQTGLALQLSSLAAACREAIEKIGAVVDRVEDHTWRPAAALQLDPDLDRAESGRAASTSRTAAAASMGEAMKAFLAANEGWRNRVLRRHFEAECGEVERAGMAVEAVAADLVRRAGQVALSFGERGAAEPRILYDPRDNALSLKLAGKSQVGKDRELRLAHQKDRNGKELRDRWTSAELEAAQEAYRLACLAAGDAVTRVLRKLAEDLADSVPHLSAASSFALIAAALDAHVNEARRRGWALPFQHHPSPPGGPRQPVEVVDMWPYWLDGSQPSTVKNSFSMDSMFFLTGPNMAGKSTILRSTCAVALLGACGLFAPVRSASLPYLDAFMLRNFSADSPLEGRSSFAVEMMEMRYVLEDVTADSLVLVDELGKGTEAAAGAALAGALLEALDERRCRGVFATHLHPLLDMALRAPNLIKMMMQTRPVSQPAPAAQDGSSAGAAEQGSPAVSNADLAGARVVPTWRMVPGESRESLALEVARAQRVPAPVVARAAELYAELQQQGHRAPASGPSGYSEQQPGASQPAASLHLPPLNGHSITRSFYARLADSAASPSSSALVLPERPSSPSLAPSATSSADSSSSSDGNGAEAGPSRSLDDAAEVLQHTANQYLRLTSSAHHADNGATWAYDSRTANGASVSLVATAVPPRSNPPAAAVGCSCVYVVRRPDGYFYVGQTDALRERLATHRRAGPVKGTHAMEAVYVALPPNSDGKSAASTIETHTIKALQQAGYPLLSASDARNRRTPAAAAARKRTAGAAA